MVMNLNALRKDNFKEKINNQEFDYENKFHTNVETVLTALLGIDAKDTELNKYNIVKKEYIASLKKIRFFDHEHIRKILSK